MVENGKGEKGKEREEIEKRRGGEERMKNW
jgi:hypothetical protein